MREIDLEDYISSGFRLHLGAGFGMFVERECTSGNMLWVEPSTEVSSKYSSHYISPKNHSFIGVVAILVQQGWISMSRYSSLYGWLTQANGSIRGKCIIMLVNVGDISIHYVVLPSS